MLLNLLGRLSPRTNFNLTADVMVAFDYSEKQSTRYATPKIPAVFHVRGHSFIGCFIADPTNGSDPQPGSVVQQLDKRYSCYGSRQT